MEVWVLGLACTRIFFTRRIDQPHGALPHGSRTPGCFLSLCGLPLLDGSSFVAARGESFCPCWQEGSALFVTCSPCSLGVLLSAWGYRVKRVVASEERCLLMLT